MPMLMQTKGIVAIMYPYFLYRLRE